MWDILKDIQELGYAVCISPVLEETTETSERAARVSLHGYRVEFREIGPDSLRDWVTLRRDSGLFAQLSKMAQVRAEKRRADELEHEAWEVRRQVSEARQCEILEAERGKSEMEAIRERSKMEGEQDVV